MRVTTYGHSLSRFLSPIKLYKKERGKEKKLVQSTSRRNGSNYETRKGKEKRVKEGKETDRRLKIEKVQSKFGESVLVVHFSRANCFEDTVV